MILLLQNVELPPTLEIEALDQRLMERWRGLNQYYIKSPYHLKAGLPKGANLSTACKRNPAARNITTATMTLQPDQQSRTRYSPLAATVSFQQLHPALQATIQKETRLGIDVWRLYAAADGLAAEIAQYSSKYWPESQEGKRSLALVMSLDPRYFPDELYTSKDRK